MSEQLLIKGMQYMFKELLMCLCALASLYSAALPEQKEFFFPDFSKLIRQELKGKANPKLGEEIQIADDGTNWTAIYSEIDQGFYLEKASLRSIFIRYDVNAAKTTIEVNLEEKENDTSFGYADRGSPRRYTTVKFRTTLDGLYLAYNRNDLSHYRNGVIECTANELDFIVYDGPYGLPAQLPTLIQENPAKVIERIEAHKLAQEKIEPIKRKDCIIIAQRY